MKARKEREKEKLLSLETWVKNPALQEQKVLGSVFLFKAKVTCQV